VHDDWRDWYHVVFETARGLLLKCLCCGKLHLRFDRVLVPLDEVDQEELRAARSSFTNGAQSRCRPDAHPALLHIGRTGAGILLSQAEVRELCELVDGARLFHDVES
jgi:hypothetical protein